MGKTELNRAQNGNNKAKSLPIGTSDLDGISSNSTTQILEVLPNAGEKRKYSFGSNVSSPKEKRQTINSTGSISSSSSISRIVSNDDKNANNFFAALSQVLKSNIANRNLVFISVNHIVPTLFPFCHGLQQLGRIAAIIPKGSAHINEILTQAKDLEIPIVPEHINREYLAQPQNAINFLKENIHPNEKGIIIDIGGYFAATLIPISNDAELNDRLLGIVEDTENGHQKYHEVIQQSKIPVFSVARSELKRTEDYNVGKSIVEAADTIFRIGAHTITERMSCIGVIGHGKIGKSIAEHLRMKNVREILICEQDAIIQMQASGLTFQLVDKTQLLRRSDAIFCATGMRGIGQDDFLQMKDNVYIASCTSREDEFDLKWLEQNAEINRKTYITQYQITDSQGQLKHINMMHNGDAVNFVFQGVNGPHIYAVQGLLLLSITKLCQAEGYNVKELNLLSRQDETLVAQQWLIHFEGCNTPETLETTLKQQTWVNQPFYPNLAPYREEFLQFARNAQAGKSLLGEGFKNTRWGKLTVKESQSVNVTVKGGRTPVVEPSFTDFMKTMMQLPTNSSDTPSIQSHLLPVLGKNSENQGEVNIERAAAHVTFGTDDPPEIEKKSLVPHPG